jgi:WD40 repeat protein
VLRDIYADIEGDARIAFASGGRGFATTAEKVGVSLWNVSGRDPIATFGLGSLIWDLQFTPDSTRLIAAADVEGTIVWEMPSGRETFRLSGHLGQVNRVAVSPDGRTLATASADNTVHLCHLPTGRALFTLFLHSCSFKRLEFASPSKLIVGSSLDEQSPAGIFVFDAGE